MLVGSSIIVNEATSLDIIREASKTTKEWGSLKLPISMRNEDINSKTNPIYPNLN